MKDGDIYFWRWKDNDKHKDRAPYRSYHCKSGIAIAKGGRLYDTYWSDFSHGALDRKQIKVKFQGNKNEMTKTSYPDHYRRRDIVNMQHANNSGAAIYIKVGAKKSKAIMRKYIKSLIEEKERDIESANWRIELLNEAMKKVTSGDLDGVYY